MAFPSTLMVVRLVEKSWSTTMSSLAMVTSPSRPRMKSATRSLIWSSAAVRFPRMKWAEAETPARIAASISSSCASRQP